MRSHRPLLTPVRLALALIAAPLLAAIESGCQTTESRKPVGVSATTPGRTTSDGRTYLTPHNRKAPTR